VRWETLRQLLTNRMLLGIYLGQYCITALTYFYTTWFPIYLVQARGLSIMQAGFASAGPALCGWAGGILGGIVSDMLLKRGTSLTRARKLPIVIGLVISGAILLCNFTDSQVLVLTFMSIAFFGKGIASLGWGRVVGRGAPGVDGIVRQHLQYLRQRVRDRDTRHHRIYRFRLRVIRSRAPVRIHPFRRGPAQLRGDRWPHQTAGPEARGDTRLICEGLTHVGRP